LAGCLSFDALLASVASVVSDAGVMAIENFIAGSIIPNYAPIDKNDLHIVAEVSIRIEHELVVLLGTKISDMNEAVSLPMALL